MKVGAQMKKIMLSLSAILLLTACGEKTESNENPEANRPSENIEEVDNKENIAENNESKNNVEEQKITFVPQKSDLDAGLTLENDDVLAGLNELVETADYSQIGVENDVSIMYTGLFFNVDDRLQPIFILTNKTDQSYTNIDMAVSFGATDGRMIFEEEGFHLSEEDFGVLEPYTAMPLYLGADPSLVELVDEISQTRDEMISIDYFDFETVDVAL